MFSLLASTGELVSHDKHWLSGLEASGWLGTVRSCLLASKEIANLVCIKQRCVMILGVLYIFRKPCLYCLLFITLYITITVIVLGY